MSLQTKGLRMLAPAKEQLQRRGYWQEIVRERIEKDGRRKHEDPELVANRFREQVRSDGQALIDIHAYNDRHEKPWMKRKRLQGKKRYDFDKKHVMDLAKYIEFVQENKDV
mmetsp:Transcript_132750/g.197701  ORF Transcript_132750/g.197701 Transcript_132750/m.197701 type:complete len:111 (+) Transcript_132750:112-444(+)|eukprot:CAMPEP_0117046990 /NCGR_PEP_ID=MMETSP0472-20121206/32481_1 /TAXON_ID=693140 ORGANISM="Tiarina fusus, Strain LIS" /NCGR_SAMPLE_ID=MMETSP0472 /ASSEMBLY_ACC=CAM_ASM_000603 /LENGTH=110 /DNA_ID=CAMNT_0004759533 /DNA_START=109 /DNA_END=441 /DNA_ORIENTATION=-